VDASVGFFFGAASQWGYNNSWISPTYQTRFAQQPDESMAMTIGRHAGNLVSMAQGVVETIGGAGAAGGGLAQLDSYLNGPRGRPRLDTGWLVIFDQRSGLPPLDERTHAEPTVTPAGRTITLIWA
jgi:hypothetical protein